MFSTVAPIREGKWRTTEKRCELNRNMKTIVQTSSPAALLQRPSFTAIRERKRWPSQPRLLAAVVNDADLQNPWEHAVWIVLGVVALMLVLLTFWLS